jgi:actin cytoskeleton-regulatory complex protein PAN1
MYTPIHHADSVPTQLDEHQHHSTLPDASSSPVKAKSPGEKPSESVPPADSADEESGDESDSNYLSFTDESDDEGDVEGRNNQSSREREAREHERQLVLEAAGLVVNQDVKPPPRPRKRRPAPAAPDRSSVISISSAHKDLPPVPSLEPVDHAARLDDAFDRYEAFKQTQGDINLNRLSVASTNDTLPPSPKSPVVSLAPSSSSDGRGYSHLLSFLGRSRSPINDVERPTISTLNISLPILNSPDMPSRENSPAFGSVSFPTLLKALDAACPHIHLY